MHRPLLARASWWWIGGGSAGLLLLCLAGALTWRHFRKRKEPLEGPAYRYPDPLTPFNLLALLERIQADDSLDLPVCYFASLGW